MIGGPRISTSERCHLAVDVLRINTARSVQPKRLHQRHCYRSTLTTTLSYSEGLLALELEMKEAIKKGS
jgi:hypothetical protein